MSFALNEDQTILKDAADGFFADKAPVNLLRKLRDDNATYSPQLWEEIGAMGFSGALVPEAYNGTDMGLRVMTLALEAQARSLGASPLLQTGLIGASAVSLLGNQAQQEKWLPLIAAGETKFAFACDEGPHHRPHDCATTAAKTANGWTLSGTKRFVHDGNLADQLLVLAKVPGGIGVFVIDANTKGVSRSSLSGADGRDLADISFNDAHVAEDALLGLAQADENKLARLFDAARLGVVAEMAGLMSAAFEMTNDYLKTRTQFGQLIGSFQGLQHRAAAMLVEMELSKSCYIAAIAAFESGKDAREAVSLAKARMGDTLQLVTNETIQFHGGIGMTDAHDAGFYIKRARVLEAQYGSSGFHRDRWAKLQGF